jgi:MFS transporter, ACS family, tartrate transporter
MTAVSPTLADRLMKLFWRKPTEELGERTRRRVVVHLIPYLFFLYILAYIDRVNVAVAGLGMEKSLDKGGLGTTPTVLGFGAGIFFWGYWILEVPSTLSVLKWGARWVFVRILILWGLTCMFIGSIGTEWAADLFGWLESPAGDAIFDGVGWLARDLFHVKCGDLDSFVVRQFYLLRFLLGFFEGGFFPSVILYLSLWFRAADRGKAIAVFMAAIPVSNLIGFPISGMMLNITWFDLPGWRWIFVLQGFVPVLAGIATLFFLPDRPEKATWLPPEERDWLVGELRREAEGRTVPGHWDWLGQSGIVLLLTGFYFCMNVTGYGLTTFMPRIIKSQSGLGDTGASILSALPYLMGLAALLFNAWHSDRTRERIAHAAVPLTCLSLSIFAAALFDGIWIVPLLLMILGVGTFMYAHHPAFWPLPSIFLGSTAAASAIGFINMLGNFGGFVGPATVGQASEGQTSFAPALFRLAPFPLIAVAIILFVGYLRRHTLAAQKR